MKIGVLTSQLNRWQAGIAWGKAPEWQAQFLKRHFRFIHVWCMKLVSLPEKSEMIQRENYRGIHFYKEFPTA